MNNNVISELWLVQEIEFFVVICFDLFNGISTFVGYLMPKPSY